MRININDPKFWIKWTIDNFTEEDAKKFIKHSDKPVRRFGRAMKKMFKMISETKK